MDSIDQLVTLVEEKIRFVQDRIQQINLIRFPSANPQLLIHMFSTILTRLSRRLEWYRNEYVAEKDTGARERLQQEVKGIAALVMQSIAAHLRYVEGASIERTPWNLVEPIEKLAQTILMQARFIVRPQWHYNFGILEIIGPYKRILNKLLPARDIEYIFERIPEGLSTSLPEKLYIVSFPGFERPNILLHVNFGHEIGHQIQDDFFSNEDQSYLFTIQREVEQEKAFKKQIPDEMERAAKAAEYAEAIAKIRNRALEEIMADIFSLKLFGPAAIFALHEIPYITGSFDDPPEAESYYPPWRMRIREILSEIRISEIVHDIEQLRNRDIFGVPDDLRNRLIECLLDKFRLLSDTTSSLADKDIIDKLPYLPIAYRAIENALPGAKKFVSDRIGTNSCSLGETFWVDVFQLAGRLASHVPPNEILSEDGSSQAAGIQKIVNAGWLYRLTAFHSMYVNNAQDEAGRNYFDELEALNRLVLKAVEMSDLQSEYQSYKAAGGGSK